jgi:hypothetical protein
MTKMVCGFLLGLIGLYYSQYAFSAGACGQAGSINYCSATTVTALYVRGDGHYNVTLSADLTPIQGCDPLDHTGYNELNVTITPGNPNYTNLVQSVQMAAALGSTVTLQALPGSAGRCEMGDFIIAF